MDMHHTGHYSLTQAIAHSNFGLYYISQIMQTLYMTFEHQCYGLVVESADSMFALKMAFEHQYFVEDSVTDFAFKSADSMFDL